MMFVRVVFMLKLSDTASTMHAPLVNIQNVCSWYKTSFGQLRSCPVPSDREKEELFAKVIESVYERHSSTLIAMAKGAHELRIIVKQDVTTFADSNDIQKRLDEFYMSRIGIRMVSTVVLPMIRLV